MVESHFSQRGGPLVFPTFMSFSSYSLHLVRPQGPTCILSPLSHLHSIRLHYYLNREKGRHRSPNRWWGNPPVPKSSFRLPESLRGVVPSPDRSHSDLVTTEIVWVHPQNWGKRQVSSPESVVGKSTGPQIFFPPPRITEGRRCLPGPIPCGFDHHRNRSVTPPKPGKKRCRLPARENEEQQGSGNGYTWG